MKLLKKFLSLMLVCVLVSTTVHAQEETIDTGKDETYEKVLEAYRNGDKMSEEVIAARKQAAEQLGLEAFLDERAFLSIDYRNEQGIGKDGAITDPALDILVEMATEKEMQEVLAKSRRQLRRMNGRIFTPGQNAGATQMPRAEGAGNGYFTIDGADSYGYCAENKKKFWSNYDTKYGTVSEWNDAVVRKILYYSPGGLGYAGGDLGYDMDNATFAVGYQNGSCANNGRALRRDRMREQHRCLEQRAQEMVILPLTVQTAMDTVQKIKRSFGAIMIQNMARFQNGTMLL